MSLVFSVLGMHKSGTTLVAELLNSSGVSMVETSDTRDYDDGNKCERISTNQMNKELLACGPKSSLLVLQNYVPGNKHESFQIRATAIIDEAEPEGGGLWGFKDPRTCLTHDFWVELIPDMRVICIFRSATSVREHYVRRTPQKLKKSKNGVFALRAWAVYNTAVIDAFKDAQHQNRIMLSYETLLEQQSELERLSTFVGLPVKDLRRAELNRGTLKIGFAERAERLLVKIIWGLDVSAIEIQLEKLRLEDSKVGQT